MHEVLKKIAHLSAALIFFLFAYLQLNDPDPIPWTIFYCICALPSIVGLANKSYRVLNVFVFALALLVSLLFISGFNDYLGVSSTEPLMQSMNPEKPFIEEAREFIGALIAAVLILPYVLLSFFGKPKAVK